MVATSEIEISTAQARAGASRASTRPSRHRWLKWLFAAWRHRRDVEVLSGFDDHMLADIGLTRADLHDAMAGPRWRDPTALLIDRRRERRASRRRVAPRVAGRVAGCAPAGSLAW